MDLLTGPRTGARRSAGTALRLVVVAGVVLGGVIGIPLSTTPVLAGTEPVTERVSSGPRQAGPRTPGCRPIDRPFRPVRLESAHVVGPTRVLARGRDRRGVPVPPPLTDAGKWQFAWDRAVRAGAPGVVRLTAHTYPRAAGVALGNRLLGRLRRGALLRVEGAHGAAGCYRVGRRMSVPASRVVPSYYATGGRPKLAILVCSGVRRGPGDWSRRTIWFARAVGS